MPELVNLSTSLVSLLPEALSEGLHAVPLLLRHQHEVLLELIAE